MTKPVHMCIRDDLKARLAGGEWAAGQRLPSETELARRYGVARMTVRQAIAALAAEGMVVRRQGLGTFVAERPPSRQVGALESFTEEMRSQGRNVQTRLLKATVEEPPDAARQALQLSPRSAAVTVQRLRLVDDCPIVVQNSWLPYARFAGLDTTPLLGGSLYATLDEVYGVVIVRAVQSLTAAAATDLDAALLGLPPRTPVLRTTRTTYDNANCPVEFAVSAMRPGTPIETVMERSPAGQPRNSTGSCPVLGVTRVRSPDPGRRPLACAAETFRLSGSSIQQSAKRLFPGRAACTGF